MLRSSASLVRTARVAVAATAPAVRTRAVAPVRAARRMCTEAEASNKSFFDKLPRDPKYEGLEAVIRYYLPTNDKFVIFVTANYAAVIGFAMWRNSVKKAEEAARAPPPAYPDFTKALADLA